MAYGDWVGGGHVEGDTRPCRRHLRPRAALLEELRQRVLCQESSPARAVLAGGIVVGRQLPLAGVGGCEAGRMERRLLARARDRTRRGPHGRGRHLTDSQPISRVIDLSLSTHQIAAGWQPQLFLAQSRYSPQLEISRFMGEYLELLTCVEGRYFLWSVNLSRAITPRSALTSRFGPSAFGLDGRGWGPCGSQTAWRATLCGRIGCGRL